MNTENNDQYEGWENDRNWKLGVFYFNAKDKRLFPPKRSGTMGRSVNFAHPIGIVGFLIVLGIIMWLGVHIFH